MPTYIDYEDGNSEPTPSRFDSPSKSNGGASDGEDGGQKVNYSKYKTTTKMNELSHCTTPTAQGKQNQDGGQNTAEDYPPLYSSGEEGLKRLEEHITKDKNLRDVAARNPRVQQPEFKIVGIEDNIDDEEIVERIVGQSQHQCWKRRH
ncbi:hypothetical protein HPB48_019009 [Haemaphysalis longicornis]|uniref:Uncharacterized protein n=1 Tax=Haemaphysalis longicornis TaxID=44386 RepID=A0A9J6GLU7_HAELO|nr:hypothetical protein HPB48_019009 [Haemaphysalis longicornis]